MPFLQLRDSRYPLRPGENRVGWGPEVEVRLPDTEVRTGAAEAIVSVSGSGTASVATKATPITVVLNGVPVGEPAPLLHGDRLGIGGCELRFGDEAQLGDTLELDHETDVAIAVPSPTARGSRSGGRLVSLVDGREYTVPSPGLSIGRDPSCDIVIGAPDVSRRHATIRRAERGYFLLDTSANGVFVNDARVLTELALGRGDTVRVGREEFRFYAEDRTEEMEVPDVPALLDTGSFVAAKRPTPALGTTLPPVSAVPESAPRPRPSFGFLEIINEGPSKGRRFELLSPRVHVGRGEHNDVAINDESVSEYHAKLQRRDDSWFLVDLESTNGTYLAGARISDEVRLPSGSDVRFGGVKMVFRAMSTVARPSGETRVIVGVRSPDPKRAEQRPKDVAQQEDPASREKPPASSPILWLIVLVLLILALFIVLQGGGG
ncbi:MAG: FHA domain-containing protein [Gemmatimonadaceae bacterium]